MYKLHLEKAEEPEIKLPTQLDHRVREFQKNIYFCFIDYAKALTVWTTANREKFFMSWEYQTTWPASREICMQVKKQQLEPEIEQRTGSKSGKEYCHSAYLNFYAVSIMRNTGLDGAQAGIKIAREISITSLTSDMQMTSPLWQKVKKN